MFLSCIELAASMEEVEEARPVIVVDEDELRKEAKELVVGWCVHGTLSLEKMGEFRTKLVNMKCREWVDREVLCFVLREEFWCLDVDMKKLSSFLRYYWKFNFSNLQANLQFLNSRFTDSLSHFWRVIFYIRYDYYISQELADSLLQCFGDTLKEKRDGSYCGGFERGVLRYFLY